VSHSGSNLSAHPRKSSLLPHPDVPRDGPGFLIVDWTARYLDGQLDLTVMVALGASSCAAAGPSSELLQKRLRHFIRKDVARKAAAITAFRSAITRRARRLLKDPAVNPIKTWDSDGDRLYQLASPAYELWKGMKDTR